MDSDRQLNIQRNFPHVLVEQFKWLWSVAMARRIKTRAERIAMTTKSCNRTPITDKQLNTQTIATLTHIPHVMSNKSNRSGGCNLWRKQTARNRTDGSNNRKQLSKTSSIWITSSQQRTIRALTTRSVIETCVVHEKFNNWRCYWAETLASCGVKTSRTSARLQVTDIMKQSSQRYSWKIIAVKQTTNDHNQ